MLQPKTQPWIITLSIHIYRWLIRLGPKEFRYEYGEVTLQDFRHCCRNAYTQRGRYGVLRLWPSMFTGAIVDMGVEHLSEATHREKSDEEKTLEEELVHQFLRSTISDTIAMCDYTIQRRGRTNRGKVFLRIRK